MKFYANTSEYLFFVFAAGLFSPLLATSVYAQSNSVVEEIVVTATKRDIALEDVPLTVSVFTEKNIERSRIIRPRDFLSQVSNVSLATAVRPGESNVSMRGVQGNFGLTQPVAVVVDGVVEANPNALDQELVGIQQIEVVKGPQGALYGRNANAGAIIINTIRPSDVFQGKVVAGLGNGDYWRAQALVSGPLSENIFARMAISSDSRDGFWDNDTVGHPADLQKQELIDGRMIIEATEALTIDLRAKASSLKIGAQLWDVQVPPYIPVTNNDYFPQFEANNSQPGKQTRYDFSTKIDYVMPFATLTAIGSYDDYDSEYSSDGALNTIFPGGPPTIFVNPQALLGLTPPALPGYSRLLGDGNGYAELDESDETLEIRLTSPSDQRLRWFFGGYYAHSERTTYSDTRVDTGAGVGYQILGPHLVPGDNNAIITVSQYSTSTTDDYAGFGQIEYDFTDELTGEVSLRYDDETTENLNRIPAVNSPVTGRPLTDPVIAPSGLLRKATFNELQPKYTLRYEPNENLMFFGNYGRGFRSGGFNGAGSGARVKLQAPWTDFPDNFPSETSDAFELGFKSQWFDNRLTLNGALFYTDIDNAQAFTAFPSPPITIVISLERVRAQGAELELYYQVTDNLRISNSFGFTNTKIKETVLPTALGKEVPGTPAYTNVFSVDFDSPLSSGLTMIGHFDWDQIGPMWFDVYNTPMTQRDAFALLNLRVAIEGHHKENTWQIAAWAKNLTNKYYNVYAAPVLPIANFSYRAAPRSYGVDLIYTF